MTTSKPYVKWTNEKKGKLIYRWMYGKKTISEVGLILKLEAQKKDVIYLDD